MNPMMKFAPLITIAMLISAAAWSQSAAPPSEVSFPPFEQWMGAVLTGDAASLKALYRTDPPATVRINGAASDANADISYWLGLKPTNMKVDVVRNEPRRGHISFIFRAQVALPHGETISLTDDQSWLQQGDQWKLMDVERTDAPHLAQPADMKKNLYPADADAHAEIKEAEEKAARDHKRILLVFGANWCFDCHVLDLAFHSPGLAPIVDSNYEVVHVDLGPNEEKNADLVGEYQIPLKKGIPALAVAETDGRLVVSQKNGEFEDARGLTPEALAEFLNQYKPRAR